jgi:hypothetical protein
VGSFANDDLGDGAEDDFPIESEGPVIDVFHVEGHPSLKIDRIATFDDPEAGESRAHAKAAALPPLILFHLLRNGGARADEGHVAAEDVPELGPFIDGEFAEPAAEGGEPGVVADLEDELALVLVFEGGFAFLRIGDHGAELEEDEAAAVEAAADLAEENGARGGEADEEGDDGHDGGNEEERGSGESDIDGAFDEEPDFVVGRAGEGEHGCRAEAFEVDVGVDVGEEVHGDAGADALFIAEQEGFFESGEFGGGDGEEDFIDHVTAEEIGEIGEGVDGVFGAELDGGDGGGRVEEAGEAEAEGGGVLNEAGDAAGGIAGTDDPEKVLAAVAKAIPAEEGSGVPAEEEEGEGGEGGKEGEEKAAHVEPEGELGEDEERWGGEGLAGGAAEGFRAGEALEGVVIPEPEGSTPITKNRKEEEENLDGQEEVKVVGEGEEGAGLVGGLKGKPDEEGVGGEVEEPEFALVTGEHSSFFSVADGRRRAVAPGARVSGY